MTTPTSGVLDDGEMREVADRFGVGEAQVRRDHVISHALAALSTLGTEDFVFFGGTALSRTHLPAARLSEDIDLLAVGPRVEIAHKMTRTFTRVLRRTIGRPTFAPPLEETRGAEPSVMGAGRVSVQIQLLGASHLPPWPTEVTVLEERYSDAPPARLRVLTQASFAAAKLAAWHDRAAPRDLYDLWAMASAGMVGGDAATLFSRFGPLTSPEEVSFTRLPAASEWEAALGHQCRLAVSAVEAAEVVKRAWTH
jgi:predicted nucleotidyltransferase component of viral defense system